MRRRPTGDPGLWQLQRERLQIADSEPPPRGGPVPIGASVQAFMRKAGLHSALWRQSLQGDWPRIVGELLARRTRPGEVEAGLLTVFVRHSIFLQELSRDRAAGARLLTNLRERFPDAPIRKVRFQIDPGESGAMAPDTKRIAPDGAR